MARASKKTKPAEAEEKEPSPKLITYKGFDAQMRCRGFQYEIGGHYVHSGPVKACEGGFHSCEHPLNVFDYYAPAGNRFAEVEIGGELSRQGNDTKIASAEITIKVELSIGDLVQRAWDWVWSRATLEEGASATGTRGAASATGTRGAASATGTQGAASATGYQGAASATGYQGAASATGYQGAASATGDQGAASATGTRGAASATGDQGAASATGDQGAASATGYHSVACALGFESKAKASVSGAVVLIARNAPWDGGAIQHIVAAKVGDIVGGITIKPDTWYRLTAEGQVEEVK